MQCLRQNETGANNNNNGNEQTLAWYVILFSNLQLPGKLCVVVIDEDVGDQLLFLPGEKGWSLCDVWLNDHIQKSPRANGPIPDLEKFI